MGSLASRRNALIVSLGWWVLRRRLRQRARAALAGLPGQAAPRARSTLGRTVLLLAALAGGGYAAWRWRCGSCAAEPGQQSVAGATEAGAAPSGAR